ncbi:unnamed protein product [Gongylonema pulchrum]|uniref:Cohesin loading complex subunit SCC4 homolog n=1 Tax=Gongylonema pulchrum TaxID=637853 RepID=A0A183EZC0_9BILA|nr:unnamed protein product [Gongylonema pulchrum]
MYCWFVRLPDDAERQFQAALRTAKDTELWTVINLSLAIVYLMTCRETDFYGLFERITPGKLQSSSELLKASAYFVHALHSYLHSRVQEANLAIVYLMTCRETDFYGLFERITPGKLQSSSELLKASAYFVHALHSYLHSRVQEAKSHITDSVTIIREEAVPRIQALAALFSAKMVAFEMPDMLVSANEFVSKSSDHSLALWVNQIIYG